MNGQRCTLVLLSIAVNCCIGVPIASSQNLTDEWVEKAAGPLVENRVVDGLSVGYIEGEHWGIVHLGSSGQAGKKADNLTVYELGSISKLFTSLLLADAVLRGEINLHAAADVANPAGIRLPSREGRSIKWIDLSTHRSGLPRLAEIFGPAEAAHLGRVTGRLVGAQLYKETAALLDVEAGGAEGFGKFMMRLAAGEGDEAQIALQGEAALVRREGWRLVRGLESPSPAVFEAWNGLLEGALAVHDRFCVMEVLSRRDWGDDAFVWRIRPRGDGGR